jgi:integrase
MPVTFEKGRWRFHFNRKIHSVRYRSSKLLPKGWTRARAEAFDRQETARYYAFATGIEKREPLIDEAVDLYRKHRTCGQRAGGKAERHLAALLPYFGGLAISNLGDMARRYASDQRNALSVDTIHNRLALLRTACRYAWKHHQLTDTDPTQSMIVPPPGPGRQVYVTVRELNLLLAHMDKEAAALFKLAFYTGLRWIAELLPRQPSDVRMNRGQVWLYVGMTKNGVPAMIPIHPAAGAALKYLPFSKPARDYSKAFERARSKAGMKHVRPHDLRHSLASAIISGGGTLSDVQGALRHSSATAAKRYAHLYPSRLRAIVLKLKGNA